MVETHSSSLKTILAATEQIFFDDNDDKEAIASWIIYEKDKRKKMKK